MHCSTPIAVLFIITAICTTATGTNHKPDSKGSSIEPLDEAVEDSSTNTTALERFRRLIPYMTYYLTQGQQLQLGQHHLQGGHYNQYNPVNTVPNKLDVTQPRPMSPLVGNGYLLRPLQNFYNPQLQAQQQLQAAQPQLQQLQAAQVQLQQLQAAQQQLQIQPQQLVQLKQLQPLGLARFANYRQPQILQNASPLQQSQILHNSVPLQQSQLLQNSAPLQQTQLLQNPTPLQQSQLLQNPAPLQQTQLLQNPTPLQQPHYPRLPSKPFMESDFKPMIKTQQNHQYLPKPQQQYTLKAQRPQQVTILQPTQLNYPKTIYATPKPQLYRHQIPQQRPIYLKAYQPQHKALQQYLQEITPVTKIQPVSSSAYSGDSQEQKVKSFIDHQVKEYTDQQVKDYSDSDSSVHQLSQEQQQQQEKETNNEESQQQEKNTDEEQNSYMHNSQRPSDDEVMTITQSQEIIVPQEPPQQLQQPDQTTLELTELLEGYKLSKTLPETITTSNIGSSIRTLSQILKVLQRANALSALNQPLDDTKIDYEDYANKAALPYSSTQTEASTPGRAGVDYPNYSEIPSTAFNCKDQRYKGFFGDPETNCQVWHYCDLNGGQASFLCPNGTIFSQVALTCDWWFNVKCASTPQLYVLNERLYKYILPQRPSFPEDFAGPLVDQYLTLKYHELEAKKKNATVKATTTKPTSTTETSPPLAPNVDFLTLQSLLTNEVKRRNV